MDLYYKKVLIVSDNPYLCKAFFDVCEKLKVDTTGMELMRSPSHKDLVFSGLPKHLPQKVISIQQNLEEILVKFDLVLSLHCNQLFPKRMVNNIKCINVHPGLNPFNRGWFPQVFSIINGMPIGATIHEIDEEIDHGPIIAQREVEIRLTDTSKDVYDRVQEEEIRLIEENLFDILQNTYTVTSPSSEGNIQLKADFKALTEIDLNKNVTMREAIDYFRALTHGEYKNAYFIDPKTGKKVFIKIQLEEE